MATYDTLWLHTASYGYLRHPMAPYCFIWLPMAPYGPIWLPEVFTRGLRKSSKKESHYAEPRPTRILSKVFLFIKCNCLLRRWLQATTRKARKKPLSVTREERDRQLEERSILDYNIRRELLHPAVPQHAHSRIPHKPPGDEDVAKEAQCGKTSSV